MNQEAIDKLFQKFHRVASQNESRHDAFATLRPCWVEKRQAQRLELSEISDSLQSSIALVAEMGVENGSTLTPLITVVRELSLNVTFFGNYLEASINGDEPGAVAAMFQELSKQSDAVFRKTSQLLLKFFTIQQSWRNALYLLEHMADAPSGLKACQDSLWLLITVNSQEIHNSNARTNAAARLDQDEAEKPSALDVFARILQLLEPVNLKEIFKNNDYGQQLPLHLLAKHGLLEWCRLVLGKIQETGDTSDTRDAILSMDRLKLTPLHYAVIHQHSHLVNFFSEILRANEDIYQTPERQDIFGSYLSLAVAFGNSDIVAQASCMTTLDSKSIYGTSALHVAARDGRAEIIAQLLRAGASVDVGEHPRGWTPLFEAAVNGSLEAVQCLIDHGANTAIVDCIGWTAKELATYRGHLAIAELFNTVDVSGSPQSITRAPRPTAGIVKHGASEPRNIIVSVNLGPMQVGRNSLPVQLDHFSTDPTGATESLFHMSISAAGQTHRIRLPILEDRSNVPLLFTFPQDVELQLAFKIFRDDAGKSKDGVLVYGGTALLESNKLLFGSSRQSLVREHTVSVLDSATLDIAGSILFTYVIAKPFAHLQSPKYSITELRNGDSPVTVIGHRGKF